MIMGLSFILQTAVQMYQGSTEETTPAAKQANERFDYEAAVEKQKQEGGPRRFYDDGELDIASARVADEHGNPIQEENNKVAGYEGREFVHVNVRYCTS